MSSVIGLIPTLIPEIILNLHVGSIILSQTHGSAFETDLFSGNLMRCIQGAKFGAMRLPVAG